MRWKQSIEERFLSKFIQTEIGCWLWTGRPQSQGYGKFSDKKHQLLAHCFAYEYFIGPIPEGLTIDHTCHNEDLSCPGGPTCIHRRCVNPAHLEAVTGRVNTQRGRAGEHMRLHPPKTHCPQGHEYTEESTYFYANGTYECRTCSRTKALARYHRQKGLS